MASSMARKEEWSFTSTNCHEWKKEKDQPSVDSHVVVSVSPTHALCGYSTSVPLRGKRFTSTSPTESTEVAAPTSIITDMYICMYVPLCIFCTPSAGSTD